MTLPILYTLSKTGKKQYWSVAVENKDKYAVLIIKYGFVDGKETISEKNITKGKNIGKANETTPYEQALSEATTKWNNKKKLNYNETLNEKTTNPNGVILPMLALDFNKRSKDIVFPTFVQPKIDGVRAILNNKQLQSRKGKFFSHMGLILNELKDTNLILDGELYSTSLTFQRVTGLINKETLDEKDLSDLKKIVYIVYDIILPIDFQDRYEKLTTLFAKNNFKYIKLNKTEICKSIDDIPSFLAEYIEEGYEGLIIRNMKGKYQIKHRSKNLQKLKLFVDSEFKIIDFSQGEGKEKGLVVWKCVTKENKEFNVRPIGTYEERAKLFKNGGEYIGGYLTVKYFEETDEKIPRFPVGISIRDYE